MSWFIGEYCKACNLCLQTKAQHCKPMGKLHPLPIPENCWDTVSVNFISELPESHGYDAIMVVVDSTGKHGHFIPTHTMVTALGSVQLYLQYVWKLHRLPLSVLSDRGPQFMSQFMHELYCLLGIKVTASTAYHPQTDDQTECVNQELEQYLHVFVNERQNDWDEWLPMAEFAYKNHIHSSMQHMPFFVNTDDILTWGSNLHNRPPRLKQFWNLQITWRTPSVKHRQHLQSPRMTWHVTITSVTCLPQHLWLVIRYSWMLPTFTQHAPQRSYHIVFLVPSQLFI